MEISNFYNRIETVYERISKNDIKLVPSDAILKIRGEKLYSQQ